MSIPEIHEVGDPGHLTDHNAIVETLTSFGTSITSLQENAENSMLDTDNTITIGDQSSWILRVNLPPGARGIAPPVLATYISSVLIAGLNSYGELFASSSAPGRPGFVVSGSAGQTAPLQQWQTSAGTVLVTLNADGSLTLPGGISVRASGITSDTWHSLGAPASGTSVLLARYQMLVTGFVAMDINVNVTTAAPTITFPGAMPAAYWPASAAIRQPMSQVSSSGSIGRVSVSTAGVVSLVGLGSSSLSGQYDAHFQYPVT